MWTDFSVIIDDFTRLTIDFGKFGLVHDIVLPIGLKQLRDLELGHVERDHDFWQILAVARLLLWLLLFMFDVFDGIEVVFLVAKDFLVEEVSFFVAEIVFFVTLIRQNHLLAADDIIVFLAEFFGFLHE